VECHTCSNARFDENLTNKTADLRMQLVVQRRSPSRPLHVLCGKRDCGRGSPAFARPSDSRRDRETSLNTYRTSSGRTITSCRFDTSVTN
jgi:hypothetical protein